MADSTDPVAEAMAVLLSDAAAGLIGPVVSRRAVLASLTPLQVLYRPGRRVTVTYDAVLEWPDGYRPRERIVATANRRAQLPDVATVTVGELPAAVWRAPEDPHLPGLGVALDPPVAERLLREAGVPAVGATATLRAYRPGRRAVVEARPKTLERPRLVISAGSQRVRTARLAATEGLYLKVVRPDAAGRIADVHEALRRVVPVAPCSVADGSGILRLGALDGRTLGSTLRRGLAPPPPAALLELLDLVAGVQVDGEAEEASDESLRDYAELVRALVPEEAARLERLVTAFSGAVQQPRITVHGDFHEGNLLVDEQRVTGLLDVDDTGPGERVEDLGLMVGRVWALAHQHDEQHAVRYTEAMLRCFDTAVDPAELRRRAGVALVGRATGPFRNQIDDWRELTRERLELAERWAAQHGG